MHPLLVTRLPYMGTSSLLQVAWLQQSFFLAGPDSSKQVGVVTFKKSSLVRWSILIHILHEHDEESEQPLTDGNDPDDKTSHQRGRSP